VMSSSIHRLPSFARYVLVRAEVSRVPYKLCLLYCPPVSCTSPSWPFSINAFSHRSTVSSFDCPQYLQETPPPPYTPRQHEDAGKEGDRHATVAAWEEWLTEGLGLGIQVSLASRLHD
jgi:hypothetical protein